MDENGGHMVEKVLNLTLEIIYLLTGQSFPAIRSGDHVTITVPSPSSLKPKRNNNKKVLEVTNEIIELLTGEVPIRCQDVTVYFSMEEWEYLEGHKDLYKDIVMMEDQLPLTSPDGSSNRNPPERCPRPLDSQVSIKGDQNIPHHDQCEDLKDVKVNVKIEEEERLVRGDPQSVEEGCLLYSQNSIVEDHKKHTHNDQVQDKKDIKLEVKEEEETLIRGNEQSMEKGERVMESKQEESSPHENTDGYYVWNTCEGNLILSHVHNAEDDLNTQSSTDPSKPEESYTSTQQSSQSVVGSTDPCNLKIQYPYPCSECGEGFTERKLLVIHQKSHTEHLFSCSRCEKCFADKEKLLLHQRSHTSTPPFYCSHCGKRYMREGNLLKHQKWHKGESGFSCSECGKCFIQERNLLKHQICHTIECPYSCSECGKSFSEKTELLIHQKSHIAERPYPCLICGDRFMQESSLTIHQRIHSSEYPYSCSDCGKGFIEKSELIKHQKRVKDRPHSCTECGKSFRKRKSLITHQKTHTS